jgi:hypothetical protein
MAQYLLVTARNLRTNQVQKQQDLTGARFTARTRSLAEDKARQMADELTRRTGDSWIPELREYSA